ncbi:unnamed protein product [Schistocephalus solidus]|uniref:GMC_oxred_C domain-containing protein n=1 Tax=Schistocephalus solidus TaxID=70667 RepID=A0A183TC62_SCHSO|nr:unnamed protein product [Schistocephalus solidus]
MSFRTLGDQPLSDGFEIYSSIKEDEHDNFPCNAAKGIVLVTAKKVKVPFPLAELGNCRVPEAFGGLALSAASSLAVKGIRLSAKDCHACGIAPESNAPINDIFSYKMF